MKHDVGSKCDDVLQFVQKPSSSELPVNKPSHSPALCLTSVSLVQRR